jgi:hypothetical protein
MIRTALGLVGMAGMILAASCSAHASDAIRFEVHSPSTVTVERLPSGGFRITVEPLGDGATPVPPKPGPQPADPIGDALSRLPDAERIPTAWLFAKQAESAVDMLDAFRTADEFGLWLVANVKRGINATFVDAHSAELDAIGRAVATMEGSTLAEKLANYRERLAEVIE